MSIVELILVLVLVVFILTAFCFGFLTGMTSERYRHTPPQSNTTDQLNTGQIDQVEDILNSRITRLNFEVQKLKDEFHYESTSTQEFPITTQSDSQTITLEIPLAEEIRD